MISVSGNISKCFYTRYLEKVDFAIFCHLRSVVQNSRVLYANRSGIYLYFVILLCGDIHQNPGPAVFNCGVCGLNVSNADKAICCDMCEKWVHVTCDPYISESEYDRLVQNPTADPWYCCTCIDGSTTDESAVYNSSSLPVSLHGICLNARSVFPKRFDLLAYLSTLDPDVVAINETFLDESIVSSLISPPSYTIFRRDRNRHGGGVLILTKSTIPAVRRFDLETNCELIWLQLFTKSGPLLFGTFYRPPSMSTTDLQELNSSLSMITDKYPILICGDFNVLNIDWSLISPTCSSPVNTFICSLVNDNFFTQLVHHPTRQEHILDLVLTNCPKLFHSVKPIENLPDTDHEAVEFYVLVSSLRESNTNRTLYNYTKANFANFQDVLSHVPWDHVCFDTDIESAWTCWKDLFFSVVNSEIPTVKWKRHKKKHWFLSDTIHLIRIKHRLYRRMKKS